ncbi:MAG: hypothetical protein AAFV53_37160 [Myxococcota bacterium]
MKSTTRKHAKRIRELLDAVDVNRIEQGVELALSMQDPALIAELLSGCTIDLDGNLLFNKRFTDLSARDRWGPEPDPVRQGALTVAVLELAGRGGYSEIPLLLTRLFIDRQNIPHFPDVIGLFTALETLQLPYMHIETLPDAFATLSRLHTLVLKGNRLSALPGSLLRPGLHTLVLERNQFTMIPSDLQKISTLKTLVLTQNQLTTLPDLCGLTQLVGLGLANNRLAAFPDFVRNMPALRWLDVRDNPLRTLPRDLGSLKGLATLWLDDAQLIENPWIGDALPNTRILQQSGTSPIAKAP